MTVLNVLKSHFCNVFVSVFESIVGSIFESILDAILTRFSNFKIPFINLIYFVVFDGFFAVFFTIKSIKI